MYIIIALVNIKTSKYLSKTNEVETMLEMGEKNTIPTFLLISWNSRYMVRITVIWLSVKYQNFFSFQNVTSPPHAVNVPFISSHIKVSMSSLQPDLSTWQFYLPCGLFFFQLYFLPEAEFNSFSKKIVLVMRNCCITMSEIELIFRRAEFRCNGSL